VGKKREQLFIFKDVLFRMWIILNFFKIVVVLDPHALSLTNPLSLKVHL
jgi:hypothetical protein